MSSRKKKTRSRIPKSVRVGRDSRGRYIKLDRRKIYIPDSFFKDFSTPELIRWIISRFTRRRRRTRRQPKGREFSDAPVSTGIARQIQTNAAIARMIDRNIVSKPPGISNEEFARQLGYAPGETIRTVTDPRTGERGFVDRRTVRLLEDGLGTVVRSQEVAKKSQQEAKRSEELAKKSEKKVTETELRAARDSAEQKYKSWFASPQNIPYRMYRQIAGDDSLQRFYEDLGGDYSKFKGKSKVDLMKAIDKRIGEIIRMPEESEERKTYMANLQSLPIYKTFYKDHQNYARALREYEKFTQQVPEQESPPGQESPEPEPQVPTPEPVSGISLGGPDFKSHSATVQPTSIETPDSDDDKSPADWKSEDPQHDSEVEQSEEDVSGSGTTQNDPLQEPLKEPEVPLTEGQLSDAQISEIMAGVPGYLGTITRDEHDKLIPGLRAAWNAGKPCGWITLNLSRPLATGSESRPGTSGHWVAVAIIPGNETVAYYDSFAEPCPEDIKIFLKKTFDKIAPRALLKFKENLIREQSANTNNCGWFCIRFILDSFAGTSFADATPYNRVAKSESDIEAFKKKFPAFQWL